MSKRKTYLPRELRAGRTVFIVTSRRYGLGRTHYQVAAHLIAGKREPQPESMGRHPYRMHPAMALWAESRTDLWKTRRAAQQEADRRQAHEVAAFLGRPL
ncbi:TPA: hypothetical protein L4I31_000589 [Pseudomonas aeruginosa]|nr:hypothetical protein [Pseudomonas aeruginosa]